MTRVLAKGSKAEGARVPMDEPTSLPAVAAPSLEAGSMTGRQLGRYVVGGVIGKGGMASVYLAFLRSSAGFEKVLALKCIHDSLASDDAFVNMFLDEARIASRIGHSNVVQIFDFGVDRGTHYLAMEYLAGVPLGSLVKRLEGRIRQPRHRLMLLRAVADMCEGLHAAHTLKDDEGRPMAIVHRDVSPQNTFVTFEGTTKLIDFGIARARERLQRTSTGVLKGQFAYSAPEHVKAEDVDHRADLWSIGVMLWEVLVGERLFLRDGAAQTLFAVTKDMIRRTDALDPTVPRALADVVARCLTRERTRRFASARELGRALHDASEALGRWPTRPDLAEWLAEVMPGAEAAQQANVKRAWTMAKSESPATPQRARWFLAVPFALTLVGAGTAAWYAAGERARTDAATSDAPASPPVMEAPAPPAEPVPVPQEAETADPTAASMELPSRSRTPRMRQRMRKQARAPMASGQLTLVTPNGWAEVWLSGRKLGVTPLRTSLSSGQHVLQLRPFGHTPVQRVRVDVPSGGTVRRSVRLRR
ncbi:MAG: serine/threonine-protein kinase [Myxococcota bacterium]